MKKKPRVGIFGGTFNPLHFGHILSMRTVREKLNLQHIEVIPVYQSPFKPLISRPTPHERLEMLQKGLKNFSNIFRVNEFEIKKAQISYTLDTIKFFKENQKNTEFFLMIGCDHWKNFSSWKGYQEILTLVHLVVTSRNHIPFFFEKESQTGWVKNLVRRREKHQIHLKTQKTVHFIELPKKTLSWESKEIRKKIQKGEEVKDFIPSLIKSYIQKKKLYVV